MKWYKINLSEKELCNLNLREKKVIKIQLLKRIQCIKLKNNNWKNKDLSITLGVCIDIITNWLKAYEIGGIEGLLNWKYKGKTSKLTEKQQEDLIVRNKKKPFETAKEARTYIKDEFGYEFHLHYVQKLLKKNFTLKGHLVTFL